MLSGKELGRAIEQAINKKITSGAVKTKTEIANHFKIKTPSIYDWIKKGSISKDKLPSLWEYFSDVVGPEHWGLQEFAYSEKKQDITPAQIEFYDSYTRITEERRAVIDFLLCSKGKEPKWVDSDSRAYASALDQKAKQWLLEDKHFAEESKKSKKTGS